MTDQDNQTKFNTNCCPEGVAKVLKVVCKISHDDAMQIKENNNKTDVFIKPIWIFLNIQI